MLRKPEYSVHIQKRLYYDPKDKTPKNAKSKLRYIAFSREICCQYDLLKNIEKICKTKDSRCQIDVKTQKIKKQKMNKNKKRLKTLGFKPLFVVHHQGLEPWTP